MDELTRAINEADLGGIVNAHYPESGARANQGGSIRATWRGDRNNSGSIVRSTGGGWVLKDHATGDTYNAYQFLQQVVGLTSEEVLGRLGVRHSSRNGSGNGTSGASKLHYRARAKPTNGRVQAQNHVEEPTAYANGGDDLPAAIIGRGFTKNDCREYGIKDDDGDAVFPVPNKEAPARFKRRKAMKDAKPKYVYESAGTGAPAWHSPNLSDPQVRKVLVVEGELNAMIAHSVMEDSIACVGVPGATHELPTANLDGKEIYLYADNDKEGQKALTSWLTQVRETAFSSVSVLKSHHKDFCDVAGQDGRYTLKELIKELLAVEPTLTVLDRSITDGITVQQLRENAEQFIQGKIEYPTGYTELDAITFGLPISGIALVCALPSGGKALSIDTPIITTNGWKTMETVEVGDYVFGSDGSPTQVRAISEIARGRPCYEVRFSTGETLVTDAEHEWEVIERSAGRIPRVRTTRHMAENLRATDGLNYRVKTSGPLRLQAQELPIEPYVLGYWLGDGHSSGAQLTIGDQDFEEVKSILLEHNHVLTRGEGAPCLYGISDNRTIKRKHGGGLRSQLRRLGLLGNKHIPEVYMRGSIGQRLDLLAGLLDSDGHCSARGLIEFCSANSLLAEQVRGLIASLGYKPAIARGAIKLNGKLFHRSRVTFTGPKYPVFRIKRKAKRQGVTPIGRLRASARTILSITPVESRAVKCIVVDSKDSLFLAGASFIPTHNSIWLRDVLFHNANHGRRVMLFSPDQSADSIYMLLASRRCGIPGWRVQRRAFTDKMLEEYGSPEKIVQAWSEAFDDTIINYSQLFRISGESDVGEIKRMVESALDEGFSMFGGDYVQIFEPEDSNGREMDGKAIKDIKKSIHQWGVPFLLATQLAKYKFGRHIKRDGIPYASDIEGSGKYYQAAEQVYMIFNGEVYWKEYVDQNDPPPEPPGFFNDAGKVRVYIRKNKLGEIGGWRYLWWDKEFLTFKNLR